MASINTGMRPPGRVFSVTGGASGMGFTTASLLGEHVHAKRSTINPSVEVQLDNVDVRVAKSALRGDRLEPALLHETNAKWRQIYSVNLDGVMYCTRAQFRVMYQKPESNPSIVNVSSMAALIHGGHAYSYGTSKAGAGHFMRNAAADGI
ncbi:hypothetical protein yc1106_07025 [Curvularia clavata]|uniref:Uncharacterized protein n=1 Tax=Curvularia clavata TaxID=95742 RepID=A0A9Q8ZAU3_CURCL|nr:hypothetical protein yc1106_07025 [Curvularia clavata]